MHDSTRVSKETKLKMLLKNCSQCLVYSHQLDDMSCFEWLAWPSHNGILWDGHSSHCQNNNLSNGALEPKHQFIILCPWSYRRLWRPLEAYFAWADTRLLWEYSLVRMHLLQGLRDLVGMFCFFPLKASSNIRNSVKLVEVVCKLTSSWSCWLWRNVNCPVLQMQKVNVLVKLVVACTFCCIMSANQSASVIWALHVIGMDRVLEETSFSPDEPHSEHYYSVNKVVHYATLVSRQY